jgi:hypothetical protein
MCSVSIANKTGFGGRSKFGVVIIATAFGIVFSGMILITIQLHVEMARLRLIIPQEGYLLSGIEEMQ